MKKRGCLFRIFQCAVGAAILLAVFFYFFVVLPFWGYPFNAQRHGRPPITPPWALECWVWEDDHNTAEFTTELLEGYAKNDIPVRTVLIDSPWSLRYNDFVVDEKRFPKPAEFFTGLQDKGYRVVLWMTCNVNSKSSDTAITDTKDFYEEARRKGYLVNNGAQFKWWKGPGGFIDYTNPEARQWWHGMQQQVLDWGVDGWKLDGSDTLCFNTPFGGKIPSPYIKAHKGWMTTRGYMDLYSRCEYENGLKTNPEFVVMVRSYDTPWAHPEGFAPHDSAPLTWTGDRHHAWKSGPAEGGGRAADKDLMMKDTGEGIEAALRDILLSSEKGYAVSGDDIAGYHGGDVIPPRLYIRWAEFGAFTGFFLNGGHGERRMWLRSPEELEVIRKFSWLHTELVPYMYTQVVRCHEGGPSLIQPIKGPYHYLFGDDFLVAPIYRDSLSNTVTLPKGRWRYLFKDQEVLEGPKTFTRDYPLEEFPVYVRDGAVVPMNVCRAYTGFGDADSKDFLTWNIWPHGANEFTVENTDKSGKTTVKVAGDNPITVTLSGVKKPHILRVLLAKKPAGIALDGKVLAEGADWRYDEKDQRLWVKTSGYTEGRYTINRGQ